MFKNYLITAWRSLLRYRKVALIQMLGLSMGMAACIFIFQYVTYEHSYESSHQNHDQIYRVLRDYSDDQIYTNNVPALGPALKAEFPEVEAYTRLIPPDKFTFTFELSYQPEQGERQSFYEKNAYYADQGLIDMFTFSWVSGNAATALVEPYSIILAESTANKYFGKETNPIGKSIVINGRQAYKVTAVYKDLPANSHLQFDLICSFSSLPVAWDLENEWGWGNFYTYIQLKDQQSLSSLKKGIPAFVESKFDGEHTHPDYIFQPIDDIHLHSHYLHELSVNAHEDGVNFMIVVAIFILLIAWINYINLATARSIERAHEVGVRKVLGASKKQLIWQFLTEAAILNMLAILGALTIIQIIRPTFASFSGINESIFSIWDAQLLIILGGIFVGGTLLAALYPAWIISGFRPVKILKGKLSSFKDGILLRKGLVIFQFAVSVALITGTFGVYQQLSFLRNQNLGLNVDQMLVISRPAVDDSTLNTSTERFRNSVLTNPAVKSIAASSSVPGYELTWSRAVYLSEQDSDDYVDAKVIGVDEHFVPHFGLRVLAGRNFSEDRSTDTEAIILNETAARMIGISGFDEAIGKTILFEGNPRRLTGIISDYHQESFHKSVEPHVYVTSPSRFSYISVQLETENMRSSMNSLETAFHEVFPQKAFEYFFLDEFFNKQYLSDQLLGNIFLAFSLLAILIACLGLFALSSLMAIRRRKEMSIRKVMGASVMNIVHLLSKDYAVLLLIAIIMGLPFAFYGLSEWLASFSYHISLNGWMSIPPVFIILLISGLSIIFQTLKTARTNPVESLRDE